MKIGLQLFDRKTVQQWKISVLQFLLEEIKTPKVCTIKKIGGRSWIPESKALEIQFQCEVLRLVRWVKIRKDHLAEVFESLRNDGAIGALDVDALHKPSENGDLVGPFIFESSKEQRAKIILETDERRLRYFLDRLCKSKDMGMIHEIFCVRSKNSENRFKVIVNKNFEKLIMVDKIKFSWNLLFRIGEKELIKYDPSYKSSLDYFNNNKRNKIYTKTGHVVTKVFKIDGGFIKPNISIKTISEKEAKAKQIA